MLEALKFVKGAVARKDLVPVLTHFSISGGLIKGFNGRLALCSPIELELEALPRAAPFIKAVETCRETVQMHMTPAGRLAIKSGGFKAFIDCVEDGSFPEIEPDGFEIIPEPGFLEAVKTLAPFIADDASRPWARGILFRGPSAFATNNICLLEYWLGYNFPVEINVPQDAVREIIRIGEDPEKIQVTDTSATFHFSGSRWLRTQLFDLGWPDLAKVLERESSQQPVPENLFDALEELAPFVEKDGRVYLSPGALSTSTEEGSGALSEVEGIISDGCFNGKQLALLNGVADSIDLSSYPAPCIFYGDRIRGAIIGMRQQ